MVTYESPRVIRKPLSAFDGILDPISSRSSGTWSPQASRSAGIWFNDGRVVRVYRDAGSAAMNRQVILERLNAEAPSLRRKYGFRSLAVFGSLARGDDHEGSDVDILVRFEGKATFDNFMGLKLDLEDLVGRPVDLLTPKCLRPAWRPEIEKEAIRVP